MSEEWLACFSGGWCWGSAPPYEECCCCAVQEGGGEAAHHCPVSDFLVCFLGIWQCTSWRNVDDVHLGKLEVYSGSAKVSWPSAISPTHSHLPPSTWHSVSTRVTTCSLDQLSRGTATHLKRVL
jgi:hypothetical protein